MSDRQGLPLAVELTGGQVNECTRFIPLLESLQIPGTDPTKQCLPARLAGDKGYSSQTIRNWLSDREVIPVISHRSSEKARHDEFDRASYRERNMIERCIGKLKELRRIATRYEKLSTNYMGMFKVAMIRLYLKTA